VTVKLWSNHIDFGLLNKHKGEPHRSYKPDPLKDEFLQILKTRRKKEGSYTKETKAINSKEKQDRQTADSVLEHACDGYATLFLGMLRTYF
jgi:hypothetical protein